MPKIYENDIVQAGKDPAEAKAWAAANGVEWVPAAVAQPSAALFGRHPSEMPDTTAPIQERRTPFPTPDELAQHRSEMRTAAGLALPMALGGGPGLVGAIGGGIGQLASEGLDYGMSKLSGHPEEAPTPLGGGLRTGAQVAIPYGLGKVGEAVAPLAQKMTPVLSKLPKIATEKLSQIGSAIKTVSNKTITETTAAKTAKDALLKGLDENLPKLPVADFVDRIKEKFLPFAQDEMQGLINELQKYGEGISLTDFQSLVRSARQNARTVGAKQAFNAFNNEFKSSVADHIASNPNGGPVMAQQFLDLTHETSTRLKIAEKVDHIIGEKGAIGVAQRFMTDETSQNALKALDGIAGTNYYDEIMKLSKQAAAIERRTAEVGATNASNAELLQLQKRARVVLYGMLGAAAGGATRSVLGMGGGVGGGEFLAFLLNRMGAALPHERAIAGTLGATGAIAPYATPAAIQGGKSLMDETP